MSILTSALTKLNPYMMYVRIAAIAAVFAAGCFVTSLYYDKELSDIKIAAQKSELARKDAEAKLNAKGEEVRVKFINTTNTITTKGETRIVKVIEYVPVDRITYGTIEFHNSAVESRVLQPIENVNELSEKTQQDLAIVVSKNYTTCNKYREMINSLQSLLSEIEKTYNK